MRAICCVSACLLLVCFAAYAQTDRGTITGAITDPQGAVIPNAAIEAKNLQTGAVYTAATSSTGNYTLTQLSVGPYQLTVTAPGFKQFLRTGITVSVAQTLRIDTKLEVGNISEVVTVSSEAPLLQTESGELSHTTTTNYMDSIPMVSITGMRDAFASVNLIPGAGEMSGNPTVSIFPTLRVNGAPGGSLSLAIDGQDATNTLWSAAWSMSQPSLDAIQETTIQTSNYAAEYGQVGGGLFNMTVRSGTNTFHGSAFEYLRNETMFDAANPYNHITPRDRHNDFGFTAGGPVYLPKVYDGRDKSFFFFSFEQNRTTTLDSNYLTVPTVAYRNGDFSDPSLYTGQQIGTDVLGRPIMSGAIYNPATTRNVVVNGTTYSVADPFMGCDGRHPNVICTTGPNAVNLDSVALKEQSFFPTPTNNLPVNNYLAVYPDKLVNTIYALKMDQNLSSKLKLSGYWSLNDNYVPFPDGLPAPVTTERDLWQTGNTARINLDYTVSPTQMLHLGGGLLYFSFFDPSPGYGSFNSLQILGLPGTQFKDFPTFYGLTGANGSGVGTNPAMGDNMGPNAQQKQVEEKPTVTASFNWVRSNHSYKFGAEFRIESYPSIATTPANGMFYFSAAQTGLPYLQNTTVGSGSIGFPYASFLLGDVNNGRTAIQSDFHLGKKAFGFFAQDSWKATRKLTIDYGLRYDYQTYIETDGRVGNFSPTAPNPAYGNIPGAVYFEGNGPGHCNCSFAKNYPYAFGPRLGVAYQIMPKTVFRGGIAVSWAQTALLEMDTLRMGSNALFGPSSTYGAAISQLQNGPPIVPPALQWPDFYAGQAPISPGAPFLNGFDQHAGYPPRQVMWSIGIQRELSQNLSLDISYVGNRGVWWNSDGALNDPNHVTPAILAAHNFDPTLANSTDDNVLLQPLSSLSATQLAHYNLSAPFAGFSGTVSQALRPFPQFGAIMDSWAPLGKTWYDALQVKLTKRFSHGLELNANYTFQKEMTIGADTQDTAFMTPASVVNPYNLAANKGISGLSVPHRLVISGMYTTPRANVFKPLSLAMKDWRIGTLLTYQSGSPIPAPMALNSPNPAQELSLCMPYDAALGYCNNLFGGNFGYMTRVPGVSLYTKDINSHWDPNTTFILNPAAWASPPKGQFSPASEFYNDYRYRRTPTENISLERIFRLKESKILTIRCELYNVFNRTFIPNPFNQLFVPQTMVNGAAVAGFGYASNWINTGRARSGQLVARFNF